MRDIPKYKLVVKEGKPESFGYLRISSSKKNGAYAWEKPDGKLILIPEGGTIRREIAVLVIGEDENDV